MLLQGSLQEFSLANVLQLVKMSAGTGVLTLHRKRESGKVYFRDGQVYHASLEPQVLPLGERLVREGHVRPDQLAEALAQQRDSAEGVRIGSILISMGVLDRGTLAVAIAEQIEETAFNLLGWTEGDFEFSGGGPAADEEIIVELTVEGVIMDGMRRIDEWDLVMNSLGSLQQVPRLAYDEATVAQGGVSLDAEDWRVVTAIDGRRDVGSLIRECALGRFAAAKILYRLVTSGLVVMKKAAIEGLDDATAVVVRGPIDFYNEVFVSTLNQETLTRHLLTLVVDEEEVEVPIIAVTLPAAPEAASQAGRVPGSGESGLETLVLTMAEGTPEAAWQQLAARCAAGILLVNANSVESARASMADLAAVRAVEPVPFVLVAYVSVAEEGLPAQALSEALRLDDTVPVLSCELRSREDVAGALQAALAAREP